MTSFVTRIITVFVLILSSQPSIADVTWKSHNGRFCGAAARGNWQSLINYTLSSGISLERALGESRCILSEGNSDEYVGNLLHTAMRMSPEAQDIFVGVSRELLRNDVTADKIELFVLLIRGEGTDHTLFYQLQDTWEYTPGRRNKAMFAARVICMSIDRHNIIELYDIRQNECMTPPFVEPWSMND